jgi:hypothetical protein
MLALFNKAGIHFTWATSSNSTLLPGWILFLVTDLSRFHSNIVLSLNPTYTPLLSNKLNKWTIFKGVGPIPFKDRKTLQKRFLTTFSTALKSGYISLYITFLVAFFLKATIVKTRIFEQLLKL